MEANEKIKDFDEKTKELEEKIKNINLIKNDDELTDEDIEVFAEVFSRIKDMENKE